MATYQPYKLDLGPYQEGNKADIELEMDENFPMAGVEVTFQVRTVGDTKIIEKKSTEGDIAIDGQNIAIPLEPADTRRKPGKHNYEIDFIDSEGDPFATIYGVIEIRKEVNR